MQGDGRDHLGFEIPTPPPEPRRRPTTLVAASAALAIAGLFSVAGTLLLAGSGASTATIAFVAVFGAVLLITALLVLFLVPWARTLGMGVAVVGLVFALARIVDGTEQAVIDLAAYGYVLFALTTSKDAFQRR
jgi:drug/metabolite transporter (DMT)-like permease